MLNLTLIRGIDYRELFNNCFPDLDAIGKPQSGLLLENIFWLGSYSECTKSIVDAHYCLALVTVPAVNVTKVRSSFMLLQLFYCFDCFVFLYFPVL